MNRRALLQMASGLGLCLSLRPAQSTPEDLKARLADFAGGRPVNRGRIELSLPEIVENGNSVPVTVNVISPMSEADHVRRIAVFTEKNPAPEVIEATLSPACGRAQIAFRMRMADSQWITAVAQMSDGSVWSNSVEVVVALAACLE